jgi:CrcB protein
MTFAIRDLAVVGVFGAFGAVVRYLSYVVGRAIAPAAVFPAVTLLVNLSGCFLLGLLMGWGERGMPLQRSLLLAGGVGFLGAFTTFSTFGFETLELLRGGRWGYALASALANVVLGVVLAGVGRWVVQG